MKSSEVIISVIVPVYNAEKYLKRCVDSILSQSFSDFELLLIDDGSSDLSGLFCDEYAIADKRVSAFHTDNNGVSGARQYGLNIAKGKYIQFIDSDDWIEQDCFEKLFLIAEDKNANIVISDFYVNSKNNVKIVRQWKSHSTLTLLATQDLPTFLYYMIDPLKSWCWGAILFYPFKNSRFS